MIALLSCPLQAYRTPGIYFLIEPWGEWEREKERGGKEMNKAIFFSLVFLAAFSDVCRGSSSLMRRVWGFIEERQKEEVFIEQCCIAVANEFFIHLNCCSSFVVISKQRYDIPWWKVCIYDFNVGKKKEQSVETRCFL